MLDFSKQIGKYECPKCNSIFEVSFQQIVDSITIKCNCGQNIIIKDSDGSVKRGIETINKAFNDLQKSIDNFNKV